MAYSILEQIAQNVVTTVEGVTGIGTVTRPTQRNTYHVTDKAAVIEQDAAEAPEYVTGGPAMVQWLQPFSIHLFRVVSELSPLPIDQIFNSIVADVQAVMTADGTRGGLAHDTRLGGVEYYADESAEIAEAVVQIVVEYRVSEADPFTQR